MAKSLKTKTKTISCTRCDYEEKIEVPTDIELDYIYEQLTANDERLKDLKKKINNGQIDVEIAEKEIEAINLVYKNLDTIFNKYGVKKGGKDGTF